MNRCEVGQERWHVGCERQRRHHRYLGLRWLLVGFLTVDVTALGVVMSSDSQPIEIVSGDIRVLDFSGEWRRDKIIERHGGGFDGLVGYVGTEQVGVETTRAFIERVSRDVPELPLAEFAHHLAYELSAAWVEHGLDTGLWVFIAGAEDGELRFWFAVNCDFAGGLYTNMRRAFTAVNDLDEHAVPKMMREGGFSSKREVLANRALFFRNGALIPAARIFDDFTALIERVYVGGYEGFDRIATLVDYAYLVRMRQEFIKRMFDSSKGIYRHRNPPVGGAVYVRAVNPEGVISEYEKSAL